MHFQKPMLGVPLDWSNHLNKGCVMHLAMNEGHGDKLQDLSLNGNHGAIKNMAFPSTPASGWNPGQTGVGLKFDGTDDYVDCGNNNSLDITEAITMSAWINPKSADEDGWVISKSDYSSVGGYGMYLQGTTEKIHGYAGNNTSARSDAVFTEFEEWILVTMTISSFGTSFYKNGVFVNVDNSITPSDLNNNAFNIILGGRTDLHDDPNYWFSGILDQVRIHNRALTAKEVQDYYINPWQVYLDEEGM